MNDGDRLLVLPASEAKAWANQQVEAIPAAFTTRVLPLSGSTASDLAGLLRPLVSSNGYIGPSSSANALVVTDSAANLDRLEDLVLQLDSGQRHDYELVTLHKAQASDVLAVVEGAAGGPESGVRVLADLPGNRLLILGPAKSRQRLAQLSRSLDVPAPTASQNWRVVRLQHSNAEQLAEVLGDVASAWTASRLAMAWARRSMVKPWSRPMPTRTPWCCWANPRPWAVSSTSSNNWTSHEPRC